PDGTIRVHGGAGTRDGLPRAGYEDGAQVPPAGEARPDHSGHGEAEGAERGAVRHGLRDPRRARAPPRLRRDRAGRRQRPGPAPPDSPAGIARPLHLDPRVPGIAGSRATMKAERPATPRRKSLLFLARFLALLVVFYFLVAWNPINDAVIVP